MKTLKNGTIWKDTDGNDIHAHGGHILFHEGYYYWYGEDRRDDIFVSVYRSKDLVNWEFRNHVLTTESETERYRVWTFTNLKSINIYGKFAKVNLERPKVLYNELTKQFVMWMHYENGSNYQESRCAVATCDTPDGDFIYRGSFRPYDYMSRDCTLFKDDDGTAYFVSSTRGNADLNVYRLTPDYMNMHKLANIIYHGESREAPAFFKKDGRYYILTSGCTGWLPNQGKVGWCESMEGLWSLLEDFGDETTFNSQPAFVLPVEKDGKTLYYYWADRWGKTNEEYFTSSYVVLPIQFREDGTPFIEYTDTFSGLE